jgi:AbrB family looped-hinge helix DNA binding protein
MPTSTLTSRGQTTIPKPIREALGLQPGDRVEFLVEEGQVVLRRATADITELDGLLNRSGREPVSIGTMDEAIQRGAQTGEARDGEAGSGE